MKKFLNLLLICSILLVAFAVNAQPTDTPTPVKDWLISNWAVMLTVVYELLIRLFPTGRTYSIITIVYRLISKLVPDKGLFKDTHS